MNCKQGDLAVQVSGSDRNAGKLYECLELAYNPFEAEWDWKCIALCSVWDETHNRAVPAGAIIQTFDKNLRPLRGDGITEREVTELYTPQEPITVR